MGNDGGTIVKRMHYVRVRQDGSKGDVDPAIRARIEATTCALSRKPLRVPIVGDALGRLYNKDSVVNLLLRRAEGKGSKQDVAFEHVRGLKDVHNLNMTDNPASKASASDGDDAEGPVPFLCPLNQREMNGRYRFLFIRTCGCVMSEAGLRATVSSWKASVEAEGSAEVRVACPVCATECSLGVAGKRIVVPDRDAISINGSDEEVDRMRLAWQESLAAEKTRRKEAKRDEKGKGEKRKRDMVDVPSTHGKKAKDADGVQLEKKSGSIVVA